MVALEDQKQEAPMAAQTAEDAMVAERTISSQARVAVMATEDALAVEVMDAAEAKERKEKRHGFVRHLLRKITTPWRKWAEL